MTDRTAALLKALGMNSDLSIAEPGDDLADEENEVLRSIVDRIATPDHVGDVFSYRTTAPYCSDDDMQRYVRHAGDEGDLPRGAIFVAKIVNTGDEIVIEDEEGTKIRVPLCDEGEE
jgi:hypothetical protein